MPKRSLALAAALALCIAAGGTAVAHHGLAKEFDMGKRVVLKGTIQKVVWQNPHIYYTLDVPERGRIHTYSIESVPVAMARNAGLTAQKLRGNGQQVEVTIYPGLKDPDLGFGVYLKYADGFIVTFEGFKE